MSNVLSDGEFLLSQPTPSPQKLVHRDGTDVSVLVTDNIPNPTANLDPADTLVEQFTPGPPTFVSTDGSAVNLRAEVLTPYSNVTPPGVIRVG